MPRQNLSLAGFPQGHEKKIGTVFVFRGRLTEITSLLCLQKREQFVQTLR
jgi:hypothetical protein